MSDEDRLPVLTSGLEEGKWYDVTVTWNQTEARAKVKAHQDMNEKLLSQWDGHPWPPTRSRREEFWDRRLGDA